MRGDDNDCAICPNCGMPRCPHCGECTTPVWAIPLMFQCECGWSGVLNEKMTPQLVRDAFHTLWLNVERDSIAGGLG